MELPGLLASLLLAAAFPGGEAPRDPPDPADPVSRHDVVYDTPSPEPWDAMPVGGGDLSAMVRWDGTLHLLLSKSDCWGFGAPPQAPPGSRFFNVTSPGHVRIDLGDGGRELAARRFRQRLDLAGGRIEIQLGEGADAPRIEVWGHPERKVLIVEVRDPGSRLGPARIELSEWRPAMEVGALEGTAFAREVHRRPARPHLGSTGMEGFFGPDADPLLGRGTAVAVSCPEVPGTAASAAGPSALLALPADRPTRYRVIIAAAVTPSGDPLAAARRELDGAARTSAAALEAEQRAWWRAYWSRSSLQVESPDGSAGRLCRAYHVHLYTLGCTNRGPFPAKWDGGAGLLRGDERNWGISEWVQEIRFPTASGKTYGIERRR